MEDDENYLNICSHPECNEPRATAGINKYGKTIVRKKCLVHYNMELAEKRGFSNITEYRRVCAEKLAKNLGFSSANEYKNHSTAKLAKKKGFSTIQEYRNSIHPYKRWKKNYCENLDGRLGYVCTSTIKISTQLELDHIDGNPSNNVYENFQTLCSCCHVYKTIINEDHKSPGRKLLEIRYR